MPNQIDIQISKRKLFFQLPLANATIEDVTEVKNALPKVPDNAKENIVSFKAFSVVRNKYSMNPSSGFILPGESVVLTFSMDAEYIREHQDPHTRLSLTKEEEDTIYLFFTVVPVSAVSNWVSWWDPEKPIQNTPEIQKAAKLFWKNRGSGGSLVSSMLADGTITRKRLKCIFKLREPILENLAIHLTSKDSGDAPVNAGQQNERRQDTLDKGSNYFSITQKPKALQTDMSKSGPLEELHTSSNFNVGNRTAGNTASLVLRNPDRALKGSTCNRTAYNSSSGSDMQWGLSTVIGAINNFYDPGKLTNVLLPALHFFLKSILHYRVPYIFMVALLVLSFLCGLSERSTFFSWLIVGR